ncbi:HIRAN domain-containing protein [Methylobrevis pamukkalensis]|uniref:HIRAN domain-containing protein n=1 Tax=Methylobrevis pamukkalensis TaxID=1439726 RepID=A0A1E3H1C0_9HYPH|nr:HIRAN domain-containing protein [Methylobrevis pamukkalensis]ODN70092.1 hypothetical protein A6302_02571 [Methylobrevis pamukkalensis]
MDRRLFLAALGGGLASGTGVAGAAAPSQSIGRPIESYVTNVADMNGGLPPPSAGTPLRLRRAANRVYDPRSVLIETADGRPLGYLPTAHGRVIEPLLGAGFVVAGRVEASRPGPRPSVRISITVTGDNRAHG